MLDRAMKSLRAAAAKAALCALAALALCAAPSARAQDKPAPFPEGAALPMRVGVAVWFNDLGKVNEVAGTYEASIDVRYRWIDPALKFDAKAEGGDRQEFSNEEAAAKVKKIWTPRLEIANQVGSSSRSESGLFVYSNGTVEQVQRLRVTLDSKYKLGAFPFDTQAMPVRILSTRFTANQIALAQDPVDVNASGIKETMAVAGWKPLRMDFDSDMVRGWSGDAYPQMEARVYIKRTPFAHLFAILTPFILTLLIPTVMTLYLKADLAPRMTLWGGSILALIALNFTFSIRYAALGSDSIVQQVISMGFGLQLLMAGLTATVFNPAVADRIMGKAFHAELVGFLRWAVPVGFFSLIVVRALLTAYA